MEIQLDPRGLRVRTKDGWRVLDVDDSIGGLIDILIADRQGTAKLPTNGLGVASWGNTSLADVGPTGPAGHLQGTAHGAWRKVGPGLPLVRVVAPDPKLRRPRPARQAIGMSLEELMS